MLNKKRTTIAVMVTAVTAMGQIAITPSQPPVLSQGESIQFTANRQVVWSLAPGSKGEIDQDGVYRATAKVLAKQQTSGCQLLPNDHILNTRVDTLPVHEKSEEWMGVVRNVNASARVNYLFSMPLNLTSDSTPTTSHRFLYTPRNDGEYWNPPAPDVKYQSGLYIGIEWNVDRHLFTLHPRTCEFQEIYDPLTTPSVNCPGCTAASGMKYSTNQYELPHKGGTDAAGTPIYPGTLRIDEIEQALASGGSINHMLRVTMTNRFLKPAFVWPATANAYPWGHIPYGTIIRLKSSYTSSSTNPVTQLLIRQLKEYGMIIGDGGTDLQLAVDNNTQVPPPINEAFAEFMSKALVKPGDLEIVDHSALMESSTSGEVKVDNPYVTPDDYAVVIATDATNPSLKTTRRISLRAITMDFLEKRVFVQAGSAGRQLSLNINGTTEQAVVWTMSPEMPQATVSETGLFTPPSTLNAPAITVVRASLSTDPSIFADVMVTVLPSGTLRLAAGSRNYKDPDGNTWWSWADLNGKKQWVNGFDSGHNYLCCDSGTPFRDQAMYVDSHYGSLDFGTKISMPNGDYKITARMMETQNCSPIPCKQHLEVNGDIMHYDIDLAGRAGGKLMPLDVEMPARVTDGMLYFVVRGRSPVGFHSKLAGLLIEPVSEAESSLRIEPSIVASLTPGKQHQMYAVGWYLRSGATWEILEGPGTISPTGLYTAPMRPADGLVRIRATSTTDPQKTAESVIKLLPGKLEVRPGTVKTIPRLGTQQFSAFIEGVTYTNVRWVLRGPGTLSDTGLYTAPEEIEQDTEVIVAAQSLDVENFEAQAKFTVPKMPAAIRINAGGPKMCSTSSFTDSQGRRWLDDFGYSGNTLTYGMGATIEGAPADLQKLYQCSRYTSGAADFEYNLTMPNGDYNVTLMWAEYRAVDVGWKFDVYINGTRVLENFNHVKAAGGVRKVYNQTWPVKITDRRLRLVFDGRPDAPEHGAAINAIEVVPVDTTRPSETLEGSTQSLGKAGTQ